MANGFTGIFTVGVMLLVTRGLDTSDPEVVSMIYLFYGAVHAIVLGLCVALFFKIQSTKDATPLTYTEKPTAFMAPTTEPTTVQTTVHDYDMGKFWELVGKRIVLGVVIMGAVHYKWGVVPPLIYQCMHNPMQLYDSPLTYVYLLGEKATGSLARPWKENNPMLRFVQNDEVSGAVKPKKANKQK
eukprot:PhM_4_TR10290/c0_g2_i1/m.2675